MKKFLVNGPVSPEDISMSLNALEGRKDTGGHSVFLGRVREDILGGKTVAAIEYSAYEPMLNDEADKIIDEVKSEFSDIIEIRLLHSVGTVRAGEISLLLIVSAGHRDHATRGCRKALELVKERLPVWKKEIFHDNSHHWRENE